jgi:hypothetical protein
MKYIKFKNNFILETNLNTVYNFLKVSETSKPKWENFNIINIKYNLGKYDESNTDKDAFEFIEALLETCDYKEINGIKCMKIYRAISINKQNSFKKGVGKFWTNQYNQAKIYNYTGEINYENEVILSAYCNLNDIDWDFVLGTDFKPNEFENYGIPLPIEEWEDDSSGSESEVRLIQGTTVFVESFDYKGERNTINNYYLV